MKAYLDGQTMPLQDAMIPITHRGYLLGEGVFETMRSRHGEVFRLQDHRQRLARGLRLLQFDEALLEQFDDAVASLLGHEEQYLRINIHAGDMEDIAGVDAGVHVTGIAKEFKPYPMRLQNGLRLITSSVRKQATAWSNVKTLSYLPFVLARREATTAGAHDGLLLNTTGTVAEVTTSNAFALLDGQLHAPGADQGALEGVTRQAVLEFAADAGFRVHPELSVAQLQAAEEVFVTNTTGGVVPVIQLDGNEIGGGKRGECTARFHRALEASRDP